MAKKSRGRGNKKRKMKLTPLGTVIVSIIVIVIIAIVAFSAYSFIVGGDSSAGEIQHVEEISKSVGEGEVGLTYVGSYGYDENNTLTTSYEKMAGGYVYITLSDQKSNVTQDRVGKVISGVLEKDNTLVKVNDTAVRGKYNCYIFESRNSTEA